MGPTHLLSWKKLHSMNCSVTLRGNTRPTRCNCSISPRCPEFHRRRCFVRLITLKTHTLQLHCVPSRKEPALLIAVWDGRRVAYREAGKWVSIIPGYGFFEEDTGEATIFHFAKLAPKGAPLH